MKKRILWIIASLCLALVFVFIISILICNLCLNAMEKFLIVDEEPKPADVIIVLAGDSRVRVDHGVKLYQAGYANKILFAGGSRSSQITDAQIMERQALSLGVPQDDILLEEKSISTYENAKYSLEIMQAMKFKSAILVTSPYHTRRASIIFGRFFKGIDLTTCSVPYNSSDIGKWWTDSDKFNVVTSEYFKLVWYYLFSGIFEI